MAPTAATCPCGTDRLIVTGEVASTRSRPAGTDRIAVIAAAGRCERFATVFADLAVFTEGAAQRPVSRPRR